MQIETIVETVRENERIIGILEDRNCSLRAQIVSLGSHHETADGSSEAA